MITMAILDNRRVSAIILSLATSLTPSFYHMYMNNMGLDIVSIDIMVIDGNIRLWHLEASS